METPVEIRYAGVVVGRANQLRPAAAGEGWFFLSIAEPLPVGTAVELGPAPANTGTARIEKVIESSDAAISGMYIRVMGADELAAPWTPRAAELAAEPPPPIPTPVPPRPAPTRPLAAHPPVAEVTTQRIITHDLSRPIYAPPPAEPPLRPPAPTSTFDPTPSPEPTERPRSTIVVSVPPAVPANVAATAYEGPRHASGEISVHHTPTPAPAPSPPPSGRGDLRRPTIVVAVAPPAGDVPPRPATIVISQDPELEALSEEEEGQGEPPESMSEPMAPLIEEPDDGDREPVGDLPPAKPLPNDARRRTGRRRRPPGR